MEGLRPRTLRWALPARRKLPPPALTLLDAAVAQAAELRTSRIGPNDQPLRRQRRCAPRPQWSTVEDQVHHGAVPPLPLLRAPSPQLQGATSALGRSPMPKAAVGLAAALLASGVLHLVRPAVFRALIPPVLPAPDVWIYGSGAVELGCAAGLLTRQPWAPVATAATLAAVWPGNIWYAIRVQRSSRTSPVAKAVAWARVPLQLPMIWAALSVGRASDGAPR